MKNQRLRDKKIARAKRILSNCASASVQPARWVVYWAALTK